MNWYSRIGKKTVKATSNHSIVDTENAADSSLNLD